MNQSSLQDVTELEIISVLAQLVSPITLSQTITACVTLLMCNKPENID
jgi:hypothetical protein